MSEATLSASESELNRATQELYRRTRKMRGRRGWADMNEAMDDAAERKTIRELTPEEYAHLAHHALCWHRDNPQTVRYFLPRMLEDIAKGGYSSVDAAMAMASLRESKWRDWGVEDMQPLQRWFQAWWNAALGFPIDSKQRTAACAGIIPRERACHECLKLMAFAGVAVPPLLDQWRRDDSFQAVYQLACFVLHNKWDLPIKLHRWGQVWLMDGVDAGVQQLIIQWLFEPATVGKLERAFFVASDPSVAQLLSDALELLPRVGERG